MTEFLHSLQSVLNVFVQSDVYGPPPPVWHIVLTGQASHILLGAALAFFGARLWVLVVVAGAWVAKELLGDIPNSGGAAVVYLDSLADLGFAALGFWTVRKKKPQPMNPEGKGDPPATLLSFRRREGPQTYGTATSCLGWGATRAWQAAKYGFGRLG